MPCESDSPLIKLDVFNPLMLHFNLTVMSTSFVSPLKSLSLSLTHSIHLLKEAQRMSKTHTIKKSGLMMREVPMVSEKALWSMTLMVSTTLEPNCVHAYMWIYIRTFSFITYLIPRWQSIKKRAIVFGLILHVAYLLLTLSSPSNFQLKYEWKGHTPYLALHFVLPIIIKLVQLISANRSYLYGHIC